MYAITRGLRRLSTTSIARAKINSSADATHYILSSIGQDLSTDTGVSRMQNTATMAANSFPMDGAEDDYKQLPDDSQFIEKHYDDLKHYRSVLGKPFAEFKSARELFLALSKHRPGPEQDVTRNFEGDVPDFTVSPRAKFDKFIKNLKITLKLNGGHLFTLDLLLLNRSVFEGFEKKKNGT